MNKMAAEADSLAQRVVEVIVGAMARMPTSALVPSGDPGEAGRVIAQRAALKAAAAAGVLGLPVGPLGWLTILPEMAKVWQIQAQMVSDLAAVYGQSAHGSREQMVYCLFRHGAAAAVRDLVVRVGERYAVKQGSRQAFQALAKRVGIAVSQRALGKGLARWVPVLGAVGVAGYAYFDTVQVARTAMELFARGVAEPLEGAEEGDGEGDGEGKAGAEGSVVGFESGGGGAWREGMETILAIETSTAGGSVARYEEGRVVEVIEFASDRQHHAMIFEPLRVALRRGAPDVVVVGTGPGSYSGIRVGIAAGLGISLAHGVPLIGLPSLTALGEAFGQERYAVTGDARRGAWWYAEVEAGAMVLGPVVEEEEAMARRVAAWPGQVYTLDGVSPGYCAARPVRPRADVLACRAGALTEQAVARAAAVETEPLYLRAPFITVSRKVEGLKRASV